MISSHGEETFRDGVSKISSEIEENTMDVEAQLLSMNIDAQLYTPVAVRGRQMTVEYQDESALVSTPLLYATVGTVTQDIDRWKPWDKDNKPQEEAPYGIITPWLGVVP